MQRQSRINSFGQNKQRPKRGPRPDHDRPEEKPVKPQVVYTGRSRRATNHLFYCLFLLVVCPLSQVCVSVAGNGRGLVTPAMADFSDNCPRDCNCKWANGKREADCTRAGFTTIPTNLNHEIQILRMTHNYVRILGKNVYKAAGLLNLQRIFMNHCHVQEIHPDAFRDLKIMVELDLSHNNITQIKPDTFAGNDRLQTLTLAHNFISQLAPYQFPPLKHLKTIDLSQNTLTELQRHTFDNLGNSVESVYINNNLLKSVREEVFLGLANLKSLQLHSNPWSCDCNLKNFRDWVVFRGLYTYPTACAEPERLADKLWQDVDPKDFACKPEIRVPQSVVFSQPGANVTLSCFIIGTPMPDAKWVLKGRIVNNNTFPVGSAPPTIPSTIQSFPASSQQSPSSSTPPSTSTILSSASSGPPQGSPPAPTQYLIHEEGGLERWFNLTIINVGIDSASDYTCVAVNAGGVMEENISLTFEEPEPVGLPGGKKEESHLAIIIGAAAGGFLFIFVIMLIFCCCCCRKRRAKRSHHSGSNSSNSSRTPERQGSIVGFADSNSSQKLLLTSSSAATTGSTTGPTTTSAVAPGQTCTTADCNKSPGHHYLRKEKSQHQHYGHKHARIGGNDYQGIPQNDTDFPPPPPPSELTNLNRVEGIELRNLCSPAPPSPPRQAKTIVVSSNNTGDTSVYYHSLADPDHYPDLLNIPQNRSGICHSGMVVSPVKNTTATLSGVKVNQPLNPAALVVPPTPPPQFPHQFAHLIRTSQSNQVTGNGGTVTVPLLSPPAQFGQPGHKDDKGYVTLPRRLPSSNATSPTHRGVIDWSLMTERGPVYDGVGPRTSATGAIINQKHGGGGKGMTSIPEQEEQHQQHYVVNNTRLRTSSLKRFPTGNPHLHQPCLLVAGSAALDHRDSSGSEVTIGDESMSGYFEPFGRALPPSPSNQTDHSMNRREQLRDSIACSETDLELVLGAVGQKRQQQQQQCSMHSSKVSQQPAKQLKGILKKESSFSKTASITTNPCANAANVIVISDRESSGSPPPLSEPLTNVQHISGSKGSSKPPPPKVMPKPGKTKNNVAAMTNKNVNVLNV